MQNDVYGQVQSTYNATTIKAPEAKKSVFPQEIIFKTAPGQVKVSHTYTAQFKP